MEREAVSSSNVASVGYEEDSETLEVEFHSGAVYQYFGVPSQVHEELITAGSVGSYMANNIGSRYNSLYPYQQVG